MITRRNFLGAAASFAAVSLPAFRASAAPACPVLTAPPRRIVAIDPRTDVEPALVLGLDLVAGGYADDRPWVPFPDNTARITLPSAVEHILGFDPDLIICNADSPERDYWPYAQLSQAAPTVPMSFKAPWQDDLRLLGSCLGLEERAAAAVAEYDSMIAEMKQRHAKVLAEKRIASVLYSARSKNFFVHVPGSSEWLGIKRAMLDDLGIRTVAPDAIGGDGVTVSSENIVDILGEMDAIVVGDVGSGGLDDLASDPMWLRLPAVVAGKVRDIPGNSNYGSLFTARFVGGEIGELLGGL